MDVTKVVNSSNFIFKGIGSEDKQSQIEQKIDQIRQTAFENRMGYPEGRTKELYLFKAKSDGVSEAYLWACYYKIPPGYNCDQITGGILQYQKESHYISGYIAKRINALIIGDEETCKNTSPSFLFPWLDGNQFERVRLAKQPALQEGYFDRWEEQKKIYRESIYLVCLTYVKQMLPLNGKIIELCGGDGEFAKLVLSQPELSIAKYSLFELSREAIKAAQERLLTDIQQEKAQCVECDVTTVEYSNYLQGEQVDLVLCIGALTEQVMPSRQAALIALEKAVAHLKTGGFILLTGLTSSWITSQDLEKLGMEVINCSSPSRYQIKNVDLEFYVARKADGKVEPMWNFDLSTYKIDIDNSTPGWGGH